ncbi:glycine--tRNA ligase subunit beta [Altererythrobacter sp. Z27]|uniref:glycine--tRNA ligase subunit beta n=1 Tax=Altererythrobacter sp. Z27 TaxID=3461147 RepID=UPI004044A252
MAGQISGVDAVSRDFLLELRSEEIPARMQAGARAELEKLFRREMEAAGVAIGEISVWSTPRRLALIARGLPEATEASKTEIKGPRVGAPDQAIDGFLRRYQVPREQLIERNGIYFLEQLAAGRPMWRVLQEAIPAIIRDFAWPKSMRWGAPSLSTESLRWVRPLSGIVALLGGEVVECSIGDVASGNVTRGHRFHSHGEIAISGAGDYLDKLRAAHVIVDHEVRQDMVREGARKAAADAGLTLVEDEGLVIENAGLTEWPVPLLGRFDESYLDVPPEVIQLTARVNQKYFVCEDSAGKLANAFVCTANIAADDPAVVVDGNRKVLAARFSDARFFWELDQKTSLEDHAKKLERRVFFEGLGTYQEKSARIAELAAHIAKNYVTSVDAQMAGKAAELAKADLVTATVDEFPELQGIAGGYLANDLSQEQAEAIAFQYREDPPGHLAQVVGIADRLDTLVAFFARDKKPTGSKDPFALRRAALHSIKIITENNLRIPLLKVFKKAEDGLPFDEQGLVGELDAAELLDFFADRLKVQQREAGVRHDLIDAVFALGGEDDLVRLLARVKALQGFIGTEDGANLLAGYKRAANILKKEDWHGIEGEISRTGEEDPLAGVDDPDLAPVIAAKMAERHANELSYTPEPAEKELNEKLAYVERLVGAAITDEDFDFAMRLLATLRAPIDRFFDEVTVNADEENKRAARLDMLLRFRDAVHRVADFSRIEG